METDHLRLQVGRHQRHEQQCPGQFALHLISSGFGQSTPVFSDGAVWGIVVSPTRSRSTAGPRLKGRRRRAQVTERRRLAVAERGGDGGGGNAVATRGGGERGQRHGCAAICRACCPATANHPCDPPTPPKIYFLTLNSSVLA